MAQTHLQLLGLLLAIATAIGCLGYEKSVTSCSIVTTTAVNALASLIIVAYYAVQDPRAIVRDAASVVASSKLQLAFVANFATYFVTVVAWYKITRTSNLMVGVAFEIKYVAILAVFYVCVGEKHLTWNVALGLAFAMASFYLISK